MAEEEDVNVHAIGRMHAGRIKTESKLDGCLAPIRIGRCKVFFAPYIGDGGATEGQLLAQLILKHRLSPSPMTERVIKKHFDPMAKQFVAALHSAVPETPLNLMYLRYMLMVSTVVLFLTHRGRPNRLQRLLGSKTATTDMQVVAIALVDFVVGGIRMPVSL